MSFNIRFNTKQAEKTVAVEYGDKYPKQNVAGWEGIVCPNGYTVISDQPEVTAALEAAGIPYEDC